METARFPVRRLVVWPADTQDRCCYPRQGSIATCTVQGTFRMPAPRLEHGRFSLAHGSAFCPQAVSGTMGNGAEQPYLSCGLEPERVWLKNSEVKAVLVFGPARFFFYTARAFPNNIAKSVKNKHGYRAYSTSLALLRRRHPTKTQSGLSARGCECPLRHVANGGT